MIHDVLESRHLTAMFKWCTAERVTAVCTVLITLTGVCAFVLAYRQLHQDHEESQVSRLLDLDRQYNNEPMITYRKGYADKRLRGIEDPDEEFELLNFFEGVGRLTDRNYLDVNDVYNYFSEDVFFLYADTRDTIEQDQKADPPEYSNFVLLVSKLQPIEEQNHGTDLHPSKDDLHYFWLGEQALVPGAPGGVHRHPAKAN